MATTREQFLKLNEQSGFTANRYKNINSMAHDNQEKNYNIPAQQYQKSSIIYDSTSSYEEGEIKENVLTGL